MTIQVLIADDHKLFRQGLISLIKTREDFVQVIGEAETGEEAVRLTKELAPDIVLLDIYMPDLNGLEAARQIKRDMLDVDIVMLTSSEEDEHLKEAVGIGVSGYLLKNLDGDELFDLLAGIEKGEAAITRSMAARLLKTASKPLNGIPEMQDLTEREVEVLNLVARGFSNSDIADELCISINTVKSHLKSILSKLNLENRTQAAAFAYKTGMVST